MKACHTYRGRRWPWVARFEPPAGLGLVEVLVGVGLLVFLFLALWQVFMQSKTLVVGGQRELEMINLARSFAVQVRRFRAGLLPTIDQPECLVPPQDPEQPILLPGPGQRHQVFLPPWDPKTLQLSYTIVPLNIPPSPGGKTHTAMMVSFFIAAPNNAGQLATHTFPVVVIDES